MMAGKWVGMSYFLQSLLVFGLILHAVSDKSCYENMKEANIIPEYADSIESTDMKVCCEYTEIKCGNDYAPSLMEKRPTCYFDVNDRCSVVTVIFFGKYEDSNSTELLWLAYNVHADDLKTGFTGQSGNEIVIYTRPKNSEAPAPHIFFIYCQPNSFKDFYCSFDERNNFNVTEFTVSKNLGQPVAGIYFKITANGQLMNSTSDAMTCPRI